jgi:transposase InsO family protein
MFMKEYQGQQSVTKMAEILGVSRSGYYAWLKRKPSAHSRTDWELADIIKKIFDEHHKRYGSPRILEELKEEYHRHVGKKRVERLMRERGLHAQRKKRWVVTTNSKHGLPVAENILNRDFHSNGPGEKWVSDITYLPTTGGWEYLTTVLDLWDRKRIGWCLSDNLLTSNVSKAFIMACANRKPAEELIFHSDRGVQYCSQEFRETIKTHCPTVRQSMSRKGNCWDNACAESFFKTLKRELEVLNGRHTRAQVRTAVFEYIEIYYNKCRRHSALGYAIPVALTQTA